MSRLREISDRKIRETPDQFSRFLMEKINWDARLIGIDGARGAGKTTLLLQYLKKSHGFAEEAIYLALDDIYFAENSLLEFAEEFEKEGGRFLFLDEVHKYKDWSRDLKLIYDHHQSLRVIFTSSSALEVYKGSHDLSRRLSLYHLPGLSLREYALLKYNLHMPVLSLESLLRDHREISLDLTQSVKPIKLWKEYRETGYYPFFIENPASYHESLRSILNVVLENDLPAIYQIDFRSVLNLKKLLSIIARLVPYKPNISNLSRQIGVTWETLLRYLFYLDKAQIVKWLGKDAHGINYLNKPDKLYLQNTNLLYALAEGELNTGNIRETYFFNQMDVGHAVSYSEKGDFRVDGKYIFEVGGKGKTTKQISGLKHAYVVQDDIETGAAGKIPLWLFGLLY